MQRRKKKAAKRVGNKLRKTTKKKKNRARIEGTNKTIIKRVRGME
jgi:hypothetical protein